MNFQMQTNYLSHDLEDILLSRRNQSDLRWAAQEWEADTVYQYQNDMDLKEIIHKIQSSERVKLVIQKLNAEGCGTSKELSDNVEKIIEEMAHTQNISTIRKFALVLPKIMKSIYGQVYVNRSGIRRLKAVMNDTPVIFLPTHRSYADFILMSYIAFHYNLPFPIIAAGMDFMHMSIIGSMLRSAGAFYIKRSFINDKLYTAVFHEYVQTVFCNSGHPMEFFLEGTRSRSGKSLPPKLGLLSCITECWLRAAVPDILIVPISICYNRTLEETLYAYEMLGVPKPKESTSGMLKGLKILKEDYGNIHVHFGNIISVSDFLNSKVNRIIVSASPPHLVAASKQEYIACEALALHVLKEMQRNWVTSTWSLCCAVLLDLFWQGLYFIPFGTLLERTNNLVDILLALETRIECSDPNDVEKSLRRAMITHHNLVYVDSEDIVRLRRIHHENSVAFSTDVKLSEETIAHAVFHLHLQHYVNQGLHAFVSPGLIALILTTHLQSYESVKTKYSLLCKIFSQDFIFEKDNEDNEFMLAVRFLLQSGEVVVTPEGLRFNREAGTATISVLCGLLSPFVLCYATAVKILLSKKPELAEDSEVGEGEWKNEQELVNSLQEQLAEIVPETRRYSALSLDTCKHAFKSLLKLQALQRVSVDGEMVLRPSHSELSKIGAVLEDCLQKSQSPKAKL